MANNISQKNEAANNSQILQESESRLPLQKINFILMAVAGFMIVLGFCLMLGGSTEMDAFNPDIFSARRVVVGPTISFLGFIFMGFAIMYSPKDKNVKSEE